MTWDPHVKLRGLRNAGIHDPIVHQFHLADALGRSSEGRSDPHVSTEYYALRDGVEIQPSWFAVSEALPAFPLLSLAPSKLASYVESRFATFAQKAEQVFSIMSDSDREQVNNALIEMGYPFRLPKQTNDMYRQLTEGNWLGVMDAGEKSSSSLMFDEIAGAQRTLYARLYHQIAPLIPHGRARDQVRQRLESVVGPNSPALQAAQGKTLPEAAKAIYAEVSPKLDKITGVHLNNVSLHETTETFRLPKPSEKYKEDEADRFRFVDWYLMPENRSLYNIAHNQVADELSRRKGENPIQTIPTSKGETPLWIIVDGKKYKLHILGDKVSLVGREGNRTIEETIPGNQSITTHENLARALYQMYPNKEISVMPTAIGLMLHLRANGDLLLPEQGSHYVEQVNMVWNRMQELGLPHQLDAIDQRDIFRVHPNGISALPDNVKIILPWYLSDGFKVNKDGQTNTSDIKKHWKEVVAQRKILLENAAQASSPVEKARILFRGKSAPFVERLITSISNTDAKETMLKQQFGPIVGKIRDAAQKKDLKYLAQISAYVRGDTNILEVPEAFLQGQHNVLEQIRQGYLTLREDVQKKTAHETVLKYLIALRARELHGGIDALEYHDARPSLLTIYALFGERGVKDVIQATTAYTETTPIAVHKEVYNAEGNNIMVVRDFTGKLLRNPNYAKDLANNLQRANLDTAMVLVPIDRKDADFQIVVLGKDGKIGGMCGNGVRAVGRYAHDYLGKNAVRLLTDTGEIVRGYKDGNNFSARLSEVVELRGDTTHRFGQYIASELHINANPAQLIRELADLDPRQFHIQGVRQVLEEPHLIVTTTDNTDREAMRVAAQKITRLKTPSGKPVFPQSINVNFLSRNPDGTFRLNTYERGGIDDFTGSCGTGSICTASILFEATGQNHVSFKQTNGGLSVKYEHGHYHLSGSVYKKD